MHQIFIHAENFTVFQEKQTWEIGRLNFLYGELATGKSSLFKLIELFPSNDQEMKEVKHFQSFGPHANFENILHDKSKPLKIAFEVRAEIGVFTQNYEFKPSKKQGEGELSHFTIVFNEEIVFEYINGDGQLFTLPTLNLFEAARDFLSKQEKDAPLAEDCPTRSELLIAVFRLADDSNFIGQAEREFFQRTPALKMRKKGPKQDSDLPFQDFFFQLFEITDFNGLDEFAESLSWFVRQCFSTLGLYFQRNILNTTQSFNRFAPTAFKKIEDGFKKLDEFEIFSEEKKITPIFKDFGLPKPIRSEINDSEGNNYGYSYLFEYANKKRVQYYQLSSTEQRKIFMLTQIISHHDMHSEFNFHNDYGWMYIDNLENLMPVAELGSFIKNLIKHFPKYYFFFETRGTHVESLTKELIRSKKIKKSEIRIYHFIKNKKKHTAYVSQHTITKRNEVFPSLYNTNKIEENWKRKIPLQLHFN
ncbi:MAG: hypothetical protein NWS89_09015 [Flavobacteriales bacterium]|nr:hypothetical protein [Flavobacteriales bacterium]MDP4716579.1 hypothetical protein [Flavobacteriales bacterium]MDP4731664.1 hypothetical protein [Flavobacteriales bacterium]MDP4819036.1 hypothetical protein [Flavobacteriales bacterium]